MLDVHPPHSSTHTWSDFFIHIATICIGLLIAVGIEQTVEALHRIHERHVLIDDIRAEAEHNLHVFDDDLKVNSASEAELKAAVAAINAAVAQANAQHAAPTALITFTMPSVGVIGDDHAPSRAVWSVAKSSGKVALLPENLAEVYDRVDYEADQFFQAKFNRDKIYNDLAAFNVRSGVDVKPGLTLRLSPTACDELVRLLSRFYAAFDDVNDWTANWAGAEDSILHNAQSRDEMVPYMLHYHDRIPR